MLNIMFHVSYHNHQQRLNCIPDLTLKIRRFLDIVWDVFWFCWFTYEVRKNSLLQTAIPIDERRCFSLCRQVFIISVLLFKELEFPDMMMLVFSNRHRWHFFDTLLYAGARPNIAHLISYLIPSDFSCHKYFDKVVWFSLCLYLNVDCYTHREVKP